MTVEWVVIFVLVVVVAYLLVTVSQMRGSLQRQTKTVARLRRVVSQLALDSHMVHEDLVMSLQNERPRPQERVSYNIPPSR